MGKTTRKAKLMHFTDEDLELIQHLQDYFGIGSQNEILRMGLRALEREVQHYAQTHTNPFEKEISKFDTGSREVIEGMVRKLWEEGLKERNQKQR